MGFESPKVEMIISPKQYAWPAHKHSLNRYRDLRHYRRYKDSYIKDVVTDAIRDLDKSNDDTEELLTRLIVVGIIPSTTKDFEEMLKILKSPSSVIDLTTFFNYYS